MLPAFFDSIVALITRTSTDLPPDVRAAMSHAVGAEEAATRAGQALNIIAQNIDQAASCEAPICQDTGMPTFEVKVPVGANQIWMRARIREAIAEVTTRGKLRPNSVDSITGENSGDNLGPGMPIVHFEQWEQPDVEVKLILKGGGCENTNTQYALPADLDHLGRADRSLEGVRKCILHAVWKAQGKGCSPGALGVCIGGDRTAGYLHAKEQLFRTLDDVNPDPRLAELEASVMNEANQLSIGPMGFSGQTSLIGCKIGVLNRLPACYFVSVAYDCWAFRRLGVRLDATSGAITSWLYREGTTPSAPMLAPELVAAGFPRTGREVSLQAPITEEQVRSLEVGDIVLISGRMFTGRDAVHSYLMTHEPPVDLRGGVLYHCGPVAVKETGQALAVPKPQSGEGGSGWKITAAGPTTSIREEPYQAEVIKRYGIRAIIGKGGMGARTLAGLQESGAVYLNAIGGAAQFYARCIERVEGVSLLEFGTPEAMWHLQVRDFPAIVTMDAHGNSLHKTVEAQSGEILDTLKR
ncbi:MAG: fumarate hydratase [Acidobacteria bacterium RIFCSPLOWO2_02_FULL_67_36]|nr:MAG: fumarate hydratase [Acidobacteria bacterium RIFCSPLOWO2_02_FULL_67_36]OFW23956.1 MAG: fumarate hydratase [Acidobacteria bacterium RIFCSPLOWO2_12_FULL_66_21]